jgi:hypothetical protein
MHFSKLTVALMSILVAVHAAPTELSAREVIAANFGERTPAVTCGQFYKIEEEGAVPLREPRCRHSHDRPRQRLVWNLHCLRVRHFMFYTILLYKR